MCKPRGMSWELTGHGWHSLGDMVDPWVHASNLLKSSKNSWELTGHRWHSLYDMVDPWVHASNLLKSSKNSW